MMKANDKAVTEKLRAIAAAGDGVMYLAGQAYALAWAGEHKGAAVFFVGDEPHRIDPAFRAEVTPVGVAIYDGDGALAYYATPAAEAAEVRPGAVADAVVDILQELDRAGGPEAVLELMGATRGK